MKIALFTETYLPSINGVVTHVKILKEGLERHGHQVLVVTADPKSRTYYTSENIVHCPAFESQKFYGFGIASPLSLKRLSIIKKFDPDIVHIHHEFGIGLSGALIARVLRKPLVYTLHTMYDDYIYYVANKALAPVVKHIAHGYAKLLANSASALTGPSKKVEEFFRECGVDKPVNIIPNPVELDMFRPENIDQEKKLAFRKRWGIPEDSFVGCFCGRLGKEKSVDVLLDFWAKTVRPADNFRLVIIGDGPEREALIERAKALGIDTMVVFVGKIEHAELPPYYAGCDMYMTASVSDTNSISMLEGMATGLPVLSLVDPLNEGQIKDDINGYVFSSAEEMYARMNQLKSMTAKEMEEFRQRVRISVEQAGAEHFATYLIEIYNAIGKYRSRKDKGSHEELKENA